MNFRPLLPYNFRIVFLGTLTLRKPTLASSRRHFLKGAALLAAPAALPAQSRAGSFAQQDDALRAEYERKALALAGLRAGGAELRELMAEWPASYPPWTGPLEDYDAQRFGPLLAVSDEGENAETIARAAYACAKARVLDALPGKRAALPMAIGLMIDGERMVSAGEGPIGPDEYARLIAAGFERTLCSTNVGVRANARLYTLPPEFAIADAAGDEAAWVARVLAAFAPFLKTPDGAPRPLTVRLIVQPSDSAATVTQLVARLEAGRAQNKLGPAALQNFALLSIARGSINTAAAAGEIERVMAIARQAGLSQVAVDGDLTPAARERMSVASLLNIMDASMLRELFAAARRQQVQLVYRYQVDADSAARTIWTGLHTARSYGFTAGKFGLVPLTLEEQQRVVSLVSGWTKGWTTVPAFYVDTPLVTADDVFDESRVVEAAALWMERMQAAGARLLLFDCPDRIAARHLVWDAHHPNGVLPLEKISALEQRARELEVRPMWSGGLTPRLAFALGGQRVFAIFCTGATSRQVPVHGSFADDPDLAAEIAPTELGVRRVHAALQAGFLTAALDSSDATLAREIGSRAQQLLAAIDAQGAVEQALAALNDVLAQGWTRHWKNLDRQSR